MRPHNGNTGRDVAAVARTRTIGDLLGMFDALPPRYRRFVRNAPYNIDPAGVERLPLFVLEGAMKEIVKDSAFLAYGPDHPEARRK